MKPLKSCCNGCDAPIHYPSKVLCADCFKKLDDKFKALADIFDKKSKYGIDNSGTKANK